MVGVGVGWGEVGGEGGVGGGGRIGGRGLEGGDGEGGGHVGGGFGEGGEQGLVEEAADVSGVPGGAGGGELGGVGVGEEGVEVMDSLYSYGHETQRADGATVYGHTTPTRPTPSYLRDYHNDNIQTQLPAGRRVRPQSPKRVT